MAEAKKKKVIGISNSQLDGKGKLEKDRATDKTVNVKKENAKKVKEAEAEAARSKAEEEANKQ